MLSFTPVPILKPAMMALANEYQALVEGTSNAQVVGVGYSVIHGKAIVKIKKPPTVKRIPNKFPTTLALNWACGLALIMYP
eukprot:Pgem_evm1s13864